MLKPLGSRFDFSKPENQDHEYFKLVKDLISDETVCKMKKFHQHGDTSTFQHCLNVSYYNYKMCKFFKLDKKSGARAGLLHDLFLYDWHDYKPPKGERLHGFTHAGAALKNAVKHFELNEKEKDIIEKHMFPLNLKLPKYKETTVIILVDKYCGLIETIAGAKYTLSKMFKKNK